MLDDSIEGDLEELEAHLYSQIHHSHAVEEEPQVQVQVPQVSSETPDITEPSPAAMRPKTKNRYFKDGSNTLSKKNERKTFSKPESCAPKKQPSVGNAQRGDRIIIDKVVVFKPYKSIVCVSDLDEKTPENASAKKSKRALRRAKTRARKLQEKLENAAREQQPAADANQSTNSVMTISDDEVCMDSPSLSIVTADSEVDSKKVAKPVKVENSPKITKKAKVVANKETPTLVDDGDVVFVKAVVPVVEVINIDEDSMSLPEKNSPKSKTTGPEKNPADNDKTNEQADDTETSSVVSSNNSSIPQCSTPKKRRQMADKDRKELLSTPESTSNDFLDNADMTANQFKFNFSLHGSDFNQGEFVRPSNPITERCESESTSSMGDVNAGLKSVFSEVEFPSTSASNMFSEGNLENFSDYITPVRRSLPDDFAKSNANVETSKNTKSLLTNDCDSSSSESDYELDAQKNILSVRKNRSLPVLSPMIPEKEPLKLGTKRKISQQGLTSKFDLLADESAVDTINESKKSKKKSTLQKKLAKKLKKKRVSPRLKEKSPEKSDVSETAPMSEVQICEPDSTKNVEEPEENSNKSDNDNEVSQQPEVNKNLDQTLVKNETNAASVGEVIEILSDDENEPIIVEEVSEKAKKIDSFVIVDETFGSESHVIASDASDTETQLSLGEPIADDIQLGNCLESPKKPSEIVDKSDEQQTTTKTASPKKRKQKKVRLHKASVAEVQKQMSNDPQLWQILPSDKVLVRAGGGGKRCWHCKELGHKTMRCPNPHKPPRCKLCGRLNHIETRCPNRICMQCGCPNFDVTDYCRRCFHLRDQKCHLCHQYGHIKDRCPDLWRRYHYTTEDGPLVVPDGPALKPANELWCANCAKQGHLEYKCTVYNNSPYIQLDPTVLKYDEVYITTRTTTPKKNSPQNQNPNDNNNTSSAQDNCSQNLSNSPQRRGQKTNRFSPVSPRKIQVTFTNHNANKAPDMPVPSVNYVSPFSQNFVEHPAGPAMNMTGLPLIPDNLSPMLRNDLPPIFNGPRRPPHPYANFTNFNYQRPFLGNQQHDFFRNFAGSAQLMPPLSLAPGSVQNQLGFYVDENPAAAPPHSHIQNDIDNYPTFDDDDDGNDMQEQENLAMEHQEDSNEHFFDETNRERLFLTQSAREIQQFLAQEFRRLRKLEAEWRSAPTKHAWETSGSYRRANMILFGVKMLNRGQYHMRNLNRFRRIHPNTKLTTGNRERLYVSYKYIFGSERHNVKNYRQLLHLLA